MKIIKNEHAIKFDNLTAYIFYVDETKKGEECCIYNLYVDKDYRNQGRGSWLVKEALKEIFKAGYKKAFVVVEDKSLIPFYEKLGFVKTRYNEMYYLRGAIQMNDEMESVQDPIEIAYMAGVEEEF